MEKRKLTQNLIVATISAVFTVVFIAVAFMVSWAGRYEYGVDLSHGEEIFFASLIVALVFALTSLLFLVFALCGKINRKIIIFSSILTFIFTTVCLMLVLRWRMQHPWWSGKTIFLGPGPFIALIAIIPNIFAIWYSIKEFRPIIRIFEPPSPIREQKTPTKASPEEKLSSPSVAEAPSQPVSAKFFPQIGAGANEKVVALSAINYERSNVVYKVKVENRSRAPIGRILIRPYVEGNLFRIDKNEKEISMLDVGKSESVTFYLRPKMECGNVDISGRVIYFDTSERKTYEIELEKKTTSIICPMMKRIKIDEARWREIASSLIKVEEMTEEIPIKAEMLFEIVNDVLQELNMFRLEPNVSKDQTLVRAISRFYCEGVKGLKYCAYAEVVGSEYKSKLILRAYAENEQALIGFYHCILDEIEKRTKIKEYIPTVVKYIDIRDSVISRSDIG